MKDECGHDVRGSGGLTCKLDAGHRGAHASRAGFCESCGARRRLSSLQRYGPDEDGGDLVFCFLCIEATIIETRRRYAKRQKEWGDR